MKIRTLLSLFGLFFACIHTQAQLSEPCARILTGLAQDSIIWDAVPCAGFGGYVIYGQRNGSGSFSNLGTVSNPNQTYFVNSNNGEALWNYRIAMICNGTEQFQTAVISNQRPITPDLRNVSIVGGQPLVSWNPSPSPDVIGYYLYKENPYNSGNFFPYPSNNFLITGLQYADNAASSNLARYALVAVSPCNKGLLGEGGIDGTTGPHSSMVLEGSLDSCSQEVFLSWNRYENWRDGVQQYEIWVAINNQAPQVVDTVAGNSYVFENAQDLDTMDFFIKAIERNQPSNAAVSNLYSLRVRANRPMDFIYLTNISVNANNQTELSWLWDTDVDFQNAAIYTDGQELLAINPPLTAANNQTDPSHDPSTDSYLYQIKSTDLCGYQVASNSGKNLLLSGKANKDFINQINWQPFSLQFAQVQTYDLYRQWGNNNQRIASLDSSQTVYFDQISSNDNNQYQCCYYIVANSNLRLPNGRTLSIASRSNTVCVLQDAVIHLPNAFVPDGENRFFKPVFVFKNSISDYKMLIFDRYGKMIFETSNYNDAWRGEGLPQGVYTYAIQFKQASGALVEKRGTVLLIR